MAKAVDVQGGQVVDAFQAKSLGAMARLDSKKEAGGTAENCTAIPGVTVRLKDKGVHGSWCPLESRVSQKTLERKPV